MKHPQVLKIKEKVWQARETFSAGKPLPIEKMQTHFIKIKFQFKMFELSTRFLWFLVWSLENAHGVNFIFQKYAKLWLLEK